MPEQRPRGPQTVANYVLSAIRDGILNGRYPAGTKLDQQTLADELKVSIIPVRESLRQLQVEGFVRIHSRRGAFVAGLSVEELKEIYLIRETLEELATQLAIPNLTPQALAQLDDLIAAMAGATQAQDFAGLLELNRSFHFTIYSAAQRPLLLQLVTTMWDRSSLYRHWYTYLPERAPQALLEHQEILAACQRGDAAAAGQAVRRNIRQTTAGILSRIGEQGSTGDG